MMRGTFANIRIKNQMVPGVEGGFTKGPNGETMPMYDAAMAYQKPGTPLVIFAGKEYGTGSSRDWAAKGTRLLGVRAVIAQSFERIHRSNLIGMGVLPLQFADGESWQTLGLDGTETISIEGLTTLTPRSTGDGQDHLRRRPDQGSGHPLPHRYDQRARLLPPRRHSALRAAQSRRGLDLRERAAPTSRRSRADTPN